MPVNLQKKVLFINSNMEKNPWPVVPLGLCLVASNLKDHERRFLDLTFEKSPKNAVAKALAQFNPDFVCVGIRNIDNTNYDDPYFYLQQIKSEIVEVIQHNSPAVIILGGSALNINPVGVMDFLGVDYGIYGEGEESLGQLIRALIQNTPLAEIEGAVYRDGNEIRTNPIARIKNLDEISTAKAAEWINVKKYINSSGRINIQTKRGCSLRCTYCTYNQLEGNKERLRSPEKVVDEIEDIITKTGIKDIEFTDSVFNRPLDHASEICKEIIRRGIKGNFATMGINPGYITPEFISLLEKAGFNEISVTPESASQIVIDGLNKGFKKQDVEEAAKLLGESRLNVIWYFMFGGPGETRQTVEETIDFIRNNISKSHMVICVSAIRIFGGTPLEKIAIHEGQINENMDLLKPVFYFSHDVEPEYIQGRIRWMIDNLPNGMPVSGIEFTGIKKVVHNIVCGYLRLKKDNTPMWVYGIRIKNRIHNRKMRAGNRRTHQ